MMLPVSLSEIFVVLIVGILLLDKKEYSELSEISKLIKEKINNIKSDYTILNNDFHLSENNYYSDDIDYNSDEENDLDIYLPEEFNERQDLADEVKQFELDSLDQQKPFLYPTEKY
jgi:hypothetical protein